jgi:hypothetical protein
MFGQAIDPAIAMMQTLMTVPDEAPRYPFMEEGTHDLILVDFDHYHSKANGMTWTSDFYVVSSTNPKHQPGSFMRKSFMVQKQVPKFPTFAEREAAYARTFIGALLDGQALTLPPEFIAKFGLQLQPGQPLTISKVDPSTVAPAVMYLLGSTATQPARGIAIRAHASRGSVGKVVKDKDGKDKVSDGFVNVDSWETIPGQTGESIAGWRAKVDSLVGAPGSQQARATQQAAQQPAPVQQPAPGFGGVAAPGALPGFAPIGTAATPPQQPAAAPVAPGTIPGFGFGQGR